MSDRYVSGEYARANPGWHDEDAAHKADVVHRMIRWTGMWPSTILDVGCGTGGVLLALKERLDREGRSEVSYEGWDPAPEPIRRARQREGERIGFVCGDVLESERRADLVLCLDVFEHVPDDLAFLEALRGIGAHFLFRIPLDLSVWSALRSRKLVAERRRYGHLHLYNRPLALSLLDEAGYTLITEQYDRVPPHIEALNGRLLDRVRRAIYPLMPHRAVGLLGGFSLVVCARADG